MSGSPTWCDGNARFTAAGLRTDDRDSALVREILLEMLADLMVETALK
ncbi:MAG: hypothetical protein ACT4P2_06725 [Pseudomonadota bacterium]